MYCGWFFLERCIVRHVVEARKSGTPCFYVYKRTTIVDKMNPLCVLVQYVYL